jgi:hypothetical protein
VELFTANRRPIATSSALTTMSLDAGYVATLDLTCQVRYNG